MDLSPASITQNIAQFKSQMIGSIFGSGANSGDSKRDFLSMLMSQQRATSRAPVQAHGIPQTERKLALFDSESAHKMMTLINNREVLHKAEFAEMNKMGSVVEQIEDVGRRLGTINASTSNQEIQTKLQGFADEYNGFVQRFNPSVQPGGLLQGTQAATVSLYELEQSVKYKFFGAQDGVYGLKDLGITIDPLTKLATIDGAKLDTVLANNKQGIVNTVQEFSHNFAKSADLLNSEGNFIPNRLNNLSRAIQYIANNQQSLQAEFGLGDAAKPNQKVAQALAAYNQIFGI